MRWLWLVGLLASCDWVFRLDQVALPDALPPGVGSWSRVSAGGAHTCGIDGDNKLFCWGRNVDGETGRNSSKGMLPAPGAVDTANWTKVSSAGETTCGIRDDASLWCWGYNRYGQVGTNSSERALRSPQAVTGMWTDVAVGRFHVCAVKMDQTIACWGRNDDGQLGNGTTSNSSSPTVVNSPARFRSVAVGEDTTCAIDDDNLLYCWGDNYAPTPAVVPGDTWLHIVLGNDAGCGINTEGKLQCSGDNNNGQLGDGTLTDRANPTIVQDSEAYTWVQVAMNERTACARTNEGRVFCWGESTTGQLLVFDKDVPTPTEILGEYAWKDVAVGDGHVCLVDAAEQMFCAGKDGFSQLADGGTSSGTPVVVSGKWRDVAVGYAFTCGIDMATNKVKCAGRNNQGQLGTGNDAATNVMTMTSGNALDAPLKIATGAEHTCAQNGTTIYCWGANYDYQLGLGDRQTRLIPTSVRAGTQPSASLHTCMVNTGDLHLYCWGANDDLQINDTGTDVQSPLDITPNTTWRAVATGRSHTCGLATDNTVQCLGDRFQIGQPTPPSTDQGTLQQVALTGIASIAAGSYHTCAAAAGGTGYCWGSGYAGQLGQGNQSDQSAPVTVPGMWSTFAGGEAHTCGLTTTGALYCWGDNTYGQLGTTSTESTSTPTLISAGPWKSVSAGELHTCAIDLNDSLFCWGNNNDGQLADGMAWRATLVPIQ